MCWSQDDIHYGFKCSYCMLKEMREGSAILKYWVLLAKQILETHGIRKTHSQYNGTGEYYYNGTFATYFPNEWAKKENQTGGTYYTIVMNYGWVNKAYPTFFPQKWLNAPCPHMPPISPSYLYTSSGNGNYNMVDFYYNTDLIHDTYPNINRRYVKMKTKQSRCPTQQDLEDAWLRIENRRMP